MTDAAFNLSDEIHVRLVEWGAWARNHRLNPSTENMLAKMMRRKDEVTGEALLLNDDMTFEYEAIEKAIARMHRLEKEKRLKKVIMKYYVGLRSYFEIAAEMRIDESEIKRLHQLSLRILNRHYFVAEQTLRKKSQSVK